MIKIILQILMEFYFYVLCYICPCFYTLDSGERGTPAMHSQLMSVQASGMAAGAQGCSHYSSQPAQHSTRRKGTGTLLLRMLYN